jgi:hypothetical protein
MPRNRFVKPEVVRLFLADVHKRAHQALLAQQTPATPEEIRDSEARVREAQELNDWVDVKKRLNTGESRMMLSRIWHQQTPGEGIRLDSLNVGITKVLEYLVGWSLTDDGKPVAMRADMELEQRRATLNNLDPETFGEILKAIEDHEDAQDQARVAEKNSQAGESASSRISPLPNTSDGDSSGSTPLTLTSTT